MHDYDLDAWLGGTEVTSEQRDAIRSAWDTITTRYPTPDGGEPADVADDREQALSGAAQVILGDDTARGLVQAYHHAQTRAAAAHAVMTGALIAAYAGMSERDLAEEAGVTRMTIRKALGK